LRKIEEKEDSRLVQPSIPAPRVSGFGRKYSTARMMRRRKLRLSLLIPRD
jgi:hypothetical protein